jgi:LmbE family N-acetylglucosaminyl deacetylase
VREERRELGAILSFRPLQLGGHGGAPLRLLLLGAHSDDIEIGCGGVVQHLLASRPGCRVTWVVFSGSGAREAEAKASAADFLENAGVRDVRTLGFAESFFPYDGAAIKRAFEELKGVDPDVIFTHHRHDLHQDHRLLAELTWNTFREHLVLEYEIPKYDGDLGQPAVFVPLDAALCRRKCELIQRHFVSQRSRHWFDPELFLGLMRIRGMECRSPSGYAEAFHARKLVLG